MNTMVVVVFAVVGVLVAIVLFLLLMSATFSGGSKSQRGRLSRIVESQRKMAVASTASKKKGLFETSHEEDKKTGAVVTRLTLEKSLRYAQWKIPPLVYWLLAVVISFITVFFMSFKFHAIIVTASGLAGPMFMSALLNYFVERRYKAFDRDYPAFLGSVVSLLKTGMDTTTALDTAAQGLNENSLVREEVMLMIERLRFGVPEDKSIGSFGEDINHPEIELFVQALLLSRRVGGNLSETLNRLQKQVRKRQYFRQQAKAAVSMQRGSIWVILAIMIGMELYLYATYPEVVVESIKDPYGWLVWQFSGCVVVAGIIWVRAVTKIKI